MNFTDLIFHHARTQPHKPAVILPDRFVTYGMMAQGILSVEDHLREFDLAPGSLVSVALPSPIRFLIVAAALFRLGLPIFPVTRTAVLAPHGLAVALSIEHKIETVLPDFRQVEAGEDWFTGPPRDFDITRAGGFAAGNGICVVSRTSGTTGYPKVIALDAEAFEQKLLCNHVMIGQGDWDRMLILPGLNTIWGMTLAAVALRSGKTAVFANGAQNALQMMLIYGADCLAASPRQLQELVALQRENPVRLPSLRVLLASGGLVTPTLMAETRERLCGNVIVQYGSSEAGTAAFSTAEALADIYGASGFIAPWAEIQAVDSEDRILPPDTEGILRIRTIAMGQRYPDAGDDQDAGFRDGWFYPGDRGRVTTAGLLILSGRESEIINAGGGKFAPERIEDVARQHPSVADVAAFGATDERGIEGVWVAVVALAPIETEEFIRFCGSRGALVDRVIPVTEIPRGELGKVERERLKRRLGQA